MGLTQDTRLKMLLDDLPAEKLDEQDMRALRWLAGWSDETVSQMCRIFRKCRENPPGKTK